MTGSNLILLIGVGNALALSAALWFAPGNRAASRTLGLLLLVLTLKVMPHLLSVLGVASDPRSLIFMPLDFTYAVGPLLWLYVVRLTHMPMPRYWRWHFLPAATQFAYSATFFLRPVDAKWAWYSEVHLPLLSPIFAIYSFASLSVYLLLSWRLTARYRHWLDSAFADRDDARLFGLSWLFFAVGIAIIGGAVTSVIMLVAPAQEFGARYPLMAGIALLTYALGLLGWRNAGVNFPPFRPAPEELAPEPDETADSEYSIQAQTWERRVRNSGWWRDETLDLPGLAARLGTTPRTLSRVISEGLGENFRGFIGRIRVDAMCAALDTAAESDSILDLALASGFSSKASFNRIFLQHRGMTPSTYRAMSAKARLKNGQTDMHAVFEATENRP